MTALDWHGPSWSVSHVQAWISLQAGFTVAFCAGRDAGIASNTFAVICNHKMFHGAPSTCEIDFIVYLHENRLSVIG
jgi:hypothetical protein